LASIPEKINRPAQTAADIINFAIFDVAVTVAEAAAIAEVPFLGLPIIRTLFHMVLTKIAGYIYQPLAMNAIFTVISIQTDSQKSAYAAAEGKLRAANLTGDPMKIKEATDGFKEAFRSLVKFDGVGHTK
jgi:hypothetical protein